MNETLKKREWETGQKVSAVRRSNPFHSSSFSWSSLSSSRFHTPHPSFFCTCLCPCPPCLSVCLSGRLNADVMEREHRGGGSAMKPLSKPRLGIVFMSSPLSPKTGPLPLWAPILQMERGWAAAAQRYGSCLLRPVLRARVPSSTEHS